MEPFRPAEPGDFGDSEPAEGEPERLVAGPDVARRSRARTVVLAAAVAVGAALVAITALSGTIGSGAPQPASVQSPMPTTPSTSISWPTPRQPTPTPTRPPVFSSSGFLSDVDAVVYVRSRRAVFRIDTAAGQVTRTPLEGLDSTGAVTFLALRDRVLVRPLDDVTGYVVADGQPAVQLGGQLSGGGSYLPGPAGRVWAVKSTEDGRTTARLTDAGGRRVFDVVRSPGYGNFSADGAGGLFYHDVGGVYRATPAGFSRVTSGSITATGPDHYLTVECSARFVCSTFSSRHGHQAESRRRVGPAALTPTGAGVLSPDGRFTAGLVWGNDDGPTVQVVEVRTGRRVSGWSVSENDGFGEAPLAWLPDGRLLSLRNSRVLVFDPRTKQTVSTAVRFPPLLQLAVRPPGG